jgi:hypothetical protein
MITFQDFCKIGEEFGLYVEKGPYDSYIITDKSALFYIARYEMQTCECAISYKLAYRDYDKDIMPMEIREIDSVEELREGIKSFLKEQKDIKIKMKKNNIDEDFK